MVWETSSATHGTSVRLDHILTDCTPVTDGSWREFTKGQFHKDPARFCRCETFN